VAYYLVKQGYPVSYLNPKLTHRFAQTQVRYNKTDAQDVLLIAHYTQLHQPPIWSPPSDTQRFLTQRSRRLEALNKMRQQELNRLKSGLDDAFVCEQIQSHITSLDQLIGHTQTVIHRLIQQDDTLKHHLRLITSIKGIGTLTASLFLAEVGDFSRFDNVKQLTAYLGLDAQDFQFGSSVHRPAHISKHGNSRLRAALYLPALVAMKHNSACRLLNQRLLHRHKPGNLRVVAVMHKLLRQIFGVLKHQTLFRDNYHCQQ
jgi:transposase